MTRLLKSLDLPPIWLLAMVAAVFGLDRFIPGLGFGASWTGWIGNALVALGLGSMAAAAWEFLRARTSIIPRRTPSAFLNRGIYRLTRNPIYLGDALVLAGLSLRWDVLPGLLLVPLFTWLITTRFIRAEEDSLAQQFGEAFTDWTKRVRRWL